MFCARGLTAHFPSDAHATPVPPRARNVQTMRPRAAIRYEKASAGATHWVSGSERRFTYTAVQTGVPHLLALDRRTSHESLVRATNTGIRVCSTLHDAVLIEAPLDSLEDTTLEAQRLMKLAGSDILYGFALRSDATPVRYPGRYQPEGGQEFWHKVWGEMLHQDAPKCAVAST